MMQNSLTKRKTLIFAFFGIAIGLCIGTVLKNYRALEIVKRCNIKHGNQKSPLEIIGLSESENIRNSQKTLVFVGVMTAKNFIQGRAEAVYDTWGKEIPGRIAFFSSEGSFSSEIPIIPLKKVDDRYPPQKKSFMMLYYMYENYIDQFEWFIRSDDDVYIESRKLENFLRSIDSSKPQFIGQAGKGNAEEFGQLLLEFDENFCMGGPGVIMSRETLKRVAPHIPTCIKNLYSTHEDVEVGRCVQKFAGIPCTWNYEMQYILRHNSSGKSAYTGKLKRKEIHNAISLHPIKQGPLMYKLHSFIQGIKAEELRQESLLLHRDIVRMTEYMEIEDNEIFLAPSIQLLIPQNRNDHLYENHEILGENPKMNKFLPKNYDELFEWDFIARSLYSIHNANPKHKIESAIRESLEDVVTEVMENINNYSRQRGRVIEFRELLYGYQRLNPIHGHNLILDLLLIYKKYRGKKMTVPVRRHMYVQRDFSGTYVREMNVPAHNDSEQSSKLKNAFFSKKIQKLSNHFTIPHLNTMKTSDKLANPTIVFVLPLAGRLTTLQRFLNTYEAIAIKQDGNTELLVVLFGSKDEIIEQKNLILNLKRKYPSEKILFIVKNEQFSRGIALDTAIRSSYILNENIVLFIDVDMIFTTKTLQRIRINTIKGKQVYLPIVFSQYDSERKELEDKYSSHISEDAGYFRQFGFGICSIFKSDIIDQGINVFDKDISGWGLEDVRFLEKLVKVGQRYSWQLENSADYSSDFTNFTGKDGPINIFRAPDPSLIHIFHKIFCDPGLESAQYNMCLGTKANSLGNTRKIESIFFQNSKNLNFIMNFNKNKVIR